MITEVENIILNKEYFELTAEELSTVSDLVQNAEEYDEMKWFLASTQQALVSEKIEATPELKKNVMEYLNQDEKKRRFWLNGVGIFLFPEDKRFYQKPAFQMSLAALLLIGFLLVYDRPVDEGTMALNDTTIEETELKELEETVDTRDEGIELDGTAEQPNSDMNLLVDESSTDKAGDVLSNRNFASGAGTSSTIAPLEELKDLASDVSHPDGVYGEPFDEDAEEISMEDPISSFDDQDNNSKTNANNNEGKKDEVVLNGANNKQVDKMSRDQLKKGELKDDKDRRSKNKSGKYRKDKKDAFAKTDNEPDELVTGADIDVTKTTNNNNTQSGELNQNGYNYTNELGNENAINNQPIGGNTGNVTTTNTQPGNPQTSYETISTKEKGKVEKEQNEIMPYQQHVNDTQELKSLFKTFK